jgi:hypothetical protein
MAKKKHRPARKAASDVDVDQQTIEQLAQNVATATAALQAAALAKLQTTAALNQAEAAYQAALSAYGDALNSGTLAQQQAAAQVVLVTNAALADAQAADNAASVALATALTNLQNAVAALAAAAGAVLMVQDG